MDSKNRLLTVSSQIPRGGSSFFTSTLNAFNAAADQKIAGTSVSTIAEVLLDKKNMATSTLVLLGLHSLFEVLFPSTASDWYGLKHNITDDCDPSSTANDRKMANLRSSFYFTQLGGLTLGGILFLILQLHFGVSFAKSVGYSCLPYSLLTSFQVLGGKFSKVRLVGSMR